MSTASVLDVRGVTKVFHQRTGSEIRPLPVLDDISFDVQPREFVSVLGPSGCGKTTLLRIIVGIETADRGEVSIDGRPAGPAGRDRCIVFQNYGLLPWLTVNANVELGLEIQGVEPARRADLARKYIELVGLTGFERFYPHQISGGMQQRTGLARALCAEPKILLMDEPFGAVDAQMRSLLQDELLRICEVLETSVLFVTHSLEEAVYLSDRILVFSARPGRRVAEVAVDLPKPRYGADIRSSIPFVEMRRRVSQLLQEKTDYYRKEDAAVHAD
jgi:ABC-type nitrate/sulfonate/bicarbonate transport system ATPase subunit